MGGQENKDRCNPKTMGEQMIHHKIHQNVKHVSVIACVSAAGESIIPYIVISQDSSRVREQLRTHGVQFSTDLILKQRTEAYFNGEMFLEYIRMLFLPNFNELQRTAKSGGIC
jgi:hypothetical protein